MKPEAQSNAALAKAKRNLSRRKTVDALYYVLGFFATLVGLLTLAALIYTLVSDGWDRVTWDFFFNFASRIAAKAGILAAWVGSVLIVLTTASIGVPLGVMAGIYLEEYAPKNFITAIIEINVNNLAGVPSIVFGLLALGLFVYSFHFERSIFTGGLTLALLVLPIIIVATREAIRAIPITIREAAYAMGATRWQMIWDHVLPYSSAGILTGTIIAIGRALGETAPLITIGALTFIAFLPDSPITFTSEFPWISLSNPFGWMDDPFTVLPIQTFNWISRPDPKFHANAAAAALVLLFLTLIINAAAIYFRYRLRKRIKW
jgi:phosphate transport system permease protein